MKKVKRVGFTTSFPVEAVFAAGAVPVDLNNIFMEGDSAGHIRKAELTGFPRTICSWIKGNYAAALAADLDEVVGVVQGDCSNGASLTAMLAETGLPVWHFSFPPQRVYSDLDSEISKLEEHFEVSRDEVLRVKQRLDLIRRKLVQLDQWTWQERLVSGTENHLWLVNSSDFRGDPDRFEEELDAFLNEAAKRDPIPAKLRCAYLGVPPIYRDIYDRVKDQGSDVVFNEVQRQFAMPALLPDIVDQYLVYTYPYSVAERLADILPELARRSVDAVLSYTQSFCHLQIDNLLLKKRIDLPYLTLEGDQPENLDSRTLLRLESFFEVHG